MAKRDKPTKPVFSQPIRSRSQIREQKRRERKEHLARLGSVAQLNQMVKTLSSSIDNRPFHY